MYFRDVADIEEGKVGSAGSHHGQRVAAKGVGRTSARQRASFPPTPEQNWLAKMHPRYNEK
jgi:hypothetical protein